MNIFFLAAISLGIDLSIGDPRWLPHPVVLMGRGISLLDSKLNNIEDSFVFQRWKGLFTVLFIVLGFALCSKLCIMIAGHFDHWLGIFLSVFFGFTTIASKGLCDAGTFVDQGFDQGGLEEARRRIGQFVGRDTDHLSEAEVVRAVIETLAENTVDAIFSPLFFFCLGGAPFAIAYRAINTLDSMIAYRNERYLHFGYFAAKTDDFANFIPARLSIILLLAASFLCKENTKNALRIVRRDRKKHPSPNGGIPESLFAGALAIQLGGVNTYGGILSRRGLLGDPEHPLRREDIQRAIRIVRVSTYLAGVLLIVLGVFL